MRTALHILAVAAGIFSCVLPARAVAADDPTALMQSIEEALESAGKFFRGKNYDKAAAALAEANATFETLTAAQVPADLRPDVEALQKRLMAAERAIAKKKPSAKATAATKKSDADAPAASPAAAKVKKPAKSKSSDGAAPAAPSFTTNVAPILIARCGNCHIRTARGGLSMASYAALAQGNRNGPVVTPGASQASRLVDVIFTGRMPPGGAGISPGELAVISMWIDGGARFDGTDPTAPLGQQAQMMAASGAAAGNSARNVEFLRNLGPVLVTNCLECHGGEQPAGKLRLETFSALIEGGASGKVIVPGNPRDSLIVKRLRGLAGDRMPKDKPPVSSEAIARFETWIKNGAKFDGDDPDAPLKQAVEKSSTARMSHDELSSKRIAQAEKLWAVAAPDLRPAQLQTANFILLGNVSQDRLAEVGKVAETERSKIAKLLKLDEDGPLVKGGLTLFVLQQTSEYGEFVRYVEEREAPAGVLGHAHTKGTDLYAALSAGVSDEKLPALVAEQISAGMLLALSDVPAWFAAGAGRTIAARVEPKSPLVKKWEAEVQKLPATENADTLLSAAAKDPETVARSYAFVRSLTRKLPQFQALVTALVHEQEFDEALSEVYRHDVRELVQLWIRSKPAAK